MATGFSPRVPSEKTKKATHLFPLLSRRWPSPFLELLPLMAGMNLTHKWGVWGHLSRGVSATLLYLKSQDCRNWNERPHSLWKSSLEGRTKGMEEGCGGRGAKWPKKQGRPEPTEAWGPVFWLSSRESIHQHTLLVTHQCFPWKLVPEWMGSRVTHNKQQMAEGWLGIWHLFFCPSLKLLSPKHWGW